MVAYFAVEFDYEFVYYLWIIYPQIKHIAMQPSKWTEFLEDLEKNKQGSPVIASLLKQLKPLDFDQDRVVLGCQNQGLKFFLEKRLSEVEKLLFLFFKKAVSLDLILTAKPKNKEEPLFSFVPSMADVFSRANLSEKYNFDNFAVSGTNQVAYAAAQAVADNPGSAYNPLFLYGGVGVGKTHLAQAVAKKVLEKNPDLRVFFCPGEQFTNELIESIREKSTLRFKKKYRGLRLLIVDDIQFIAGKQTVQEEFFHTFNSVVSAGGQIILTSDQPPFQIQNLEDRIRSRFSGGMIVDIQSPDFELRTAILLIKAKEKGISIDINAAKIIAEQITDSRALEGSLISIYARILGKKNQIDLEDVDSFFSVKNEADKKRVDSSDIIKAVCSYYNIKQSRLKGDRRSEDVSLPRQVAMFLLRQELRLKLEHIAFLLKRKDHTTVIHAVDKVGRLLTKDPVFKEGVDRIIQLIYL